MRTRVVTALLLLSIAFATALVQAPAQAGVWQPSAGHVQVPIWPEGKVPDPQPMPGPETVRADWPRIENVSVPTMTVYPPIGRNSVAAVVVFPGGGFQMLAMDLEGTEICDWLVSKGITCVLLKYRVPGAPYDWHCDCRPHNRDLSTPSLQDAQRTLGLVRLHAKDWGIDPHRIGVIGFSAGGFLVAETSTHYRKRLYRPVDAADAESSRPDFAMAIYPGHLAMDDGTLNPKIPVTRDTPPTFLLMAEDDHVDGVEQALAYYVALQTAGVPTEMHLYAQGGHAFGLRPKNLAIDRWPELAEQWLQGLGVLPAAAGGRE
jgi:acetyl esterase/lipase